MKEKNENVTSSDVLSMNDDDIKKIQVHINKEKLPRSDVDKERIKNLSEKLRTEDI